MGLKIKASNFRRNSLIYIVLTETYFFFLNLFIMKVKFLSNKIPGEILHFFNNFMNIPPLNPQNFIWSACINNADPDSPASIDKGGKLAKSNDFCCLCK